MLAGAPETDRNTQFFLDGSQSGIGNMPTDGENRAKKGRESLADVIEVRLPPTPEYQPLLRATVGALAGIALFNYNEIIQLRVAVSEAFSLATKCVKRKGAPTSSDEVLMRFIVATNRLEILVRKWPGSIGQIDTEREVESCSLIESLMDEVVFGGESAGEPLIRMTKSNNAGTNQ